MGSGVSRLTNGALSGSNDESKRNLEDKASLTSTAGLQLLLEQGYLRENLRDFISTQWTPSLSDEDFQKYVQISPRTLAMNCVDFWTDIQDYVTIKPSVFQSFRAHHIYERYVVHGASHLVPLSTNVADELADNLSASIHKACSSTIFAIAESEILDYLIAEVYPAFESVRLTLMEQTKGPTMLSTVKSKLSRRRRSVFANSDHHLMLDIMKKIMSDPTYLSLFRGYMVRQEAENLLYGYNELVEIDERLAYITEYSKSNNEPAISRSASISELNASPASESARPFEDGAKATNVLDLDIQIFFYYINGFYDAYLTLGAPFRLKATSAEAMLADFHNRLATCEAIDLSIFAPIKEATLQCMIEGHLEAFLATDEFAGVVRKGRNSILGISTAMKKPLAEALLRRESMQKYLTRGSVNVGSEIAHALMGDIKEKEKGSKEGPSAFVRTSESAATSTGSDVDDTDASDSKEVMTRIELKNFIHSEYSSSLEKFLQGQSAVATSLVRFYWTSWAFQQDNFRNKFEQITESCSIFDRYISRNSDEQIGCPDTLRRSVASGLFLNSPFLFKAASDWAFDRIHDLHWKAFKSEVIARAKAELLAAKLSEGETNGVGNDESKDSNSSSLCDELGDIDVKELEACEYDISFRDGFAKLATRYFPIQPAGLACVSDSGATPSSPMITASKRRQRSFLAKIFLGSSRGEDDSEKTSAKDNESTRIPTSESPSLSPSSSTASLPAVSDPRKLLATATPAPNGPTAEMENASEDKAATINSNRRRSSFRENCQEHRRRSNSKHIEPSRQVAMSQANRSYRRNSVGAVTTIGNEELTRRIQEQQQMQSRMQEQSELDDEGDVSPLGTPQTLSRRTLQADERSVLLRNILAHPCCCSVFKEFLERESSSQTILFVVEVESYRQITSAAYQRVSARKIYNKFLHPMSIMPVPVSTETQQKVLGNLEVAGPALFKQAQDNVMEYVEMCQFPKLLKATEITLIENILKAEERNMYHDSTLGASRCSEGGVRRRMSSLYFQNVDIGEAKSLRFVLRNQLCTRFFKDFCNRIFVNESLQFWLDVEYYQGLPSAQYMRRTAYKICKKYIAFDANQEINIAYSTKKAILDNVQSPTRDLFKRAKQEIFKLLEQDAMPNFIKGPEYTAMCEALRTSSMNVKGGSMSTLQRVISRFRL